MKRLLLLTCAVLVMPSATLASDIRLSFVNHIQAGLPELDVYVPAPMYEDLVLQIRPDRVEGREDQMLYSASVPVSHNPFDKDAGGPFPKGESLGLTLGDWLGATGTAEVGRTDGTGYVRADFEGLVPEATYTLWYAMVPMPPTDPFTGALDLPLGARDGSDAELKSNADGHGSTQVSFSPCLALSNEQVLAMLALAWHSDGKTYGSSPGDFGLNSHVQIFAPLPKMEEHQS